MALEGHTVLGGHLNYQFLEGRRELERMRKHKFGQDSMVMPTPQSPSTTHGHSWTLMDSG